jgi:hypothetical protein
VEGLGFPILVWNALVVERGRQDLLSTTGSYGKQVHRTPARPAAARGRHRLSPASSKGSSRSMAGFLLRRSRRLPLNSAPVSPPSVATTAGSTTSRRSTRWSPRRITMSAARSRNRAPDADRAPDRAGRFDDLQHRDRAGHHVRFEDLYGGASSGGRHSHPGRSRLSNIEREPMRRTALLLVALGIVART